MEREHLVAVGPRFSVSCGSCFRVAGWALLLMAAACGAESAKPMPAMGASSVAAAGASAAPGAGVSPTAQAGRAAPNPGTGPGTMAMPATQPPATNTGSTAPVDNGGTPPTAAAGAGGDVPAAEGGDVPSTEGGSCLDVVTDYASMGPFEFELVMDGQIFMWVPKVPAGCKVPVTHLANGTGAGCMNYEEINSYLASHGFLASCYNSPNTGAGDQGIMALDKVFELYPDLADKKIGSTGHSQGGQASFIVLQYAEEMFGPDFKYAGLAMEPASGFGAQPSKGPWASIYGMIKSPMFMFSGTADALVAAPWVGSAYGAMGEIEAYWWSAIGATHVPTPDAHTQQVAIPWFRWKLLGDKKACEAFKALPDGDQWDAVDSKNEAPCE
jgi:hypothetical protein